MKKFILLSFTVLAVGGLCGQQLDPAKKTRIFLQLAREYPLSILWGDVAFRVDKYLEDVSEEPNRAIPFEFGAYRFALITLRAKLKFPSTTVQEKQQLQSEITSMIWKVQLVLADVNAKYSTIWYDLEVVEANTTTLQLILDKLNTVKNELESGQE